MNNLDYGVIGNCRSAALISKEGSIDWCCFPDFDSPSIFAKLLDKDKGGCLSFIVASSYQTSQKYLEHTNILSTLFESEEGTFEVLDFMPRYNTGEINDHYYSPELYRIIKLIKGNPRFKVDYSPRFNYAKDTTRHKLGPTYIKTISANDPMENIYFYSSLDFSKILEHEEISLKNDAFILLSYKQKLINIDQNRIELEFHRTMVYWLNWSNRTKKHTLFNDYIERSTLILKLMSAHRSGAILAALTTSIPETLGSERNWDYRFCWLRDASMSISASIAVGHQGAAQRFLNYINNILKSKNDTFQIMYGLRGERILTEKTLDHLQGFRGSRPVRIGNAAYKQKQNDSLGYLMDVIYHYYLYFPGTLDEIEFMWEITKKIAHTVIDNWKRPDNGIWEIRGEKKNFVNSKVMCWVALDRAMKTANLLHENGYSLRWQKESDKIKEDVLIHGWKEDLQSFSQAYENNDLDSSLLLLESYGFLSAEDERYIKTVKTIKENLMHNGLLYRYKTHDDFGRPSSAFTICTFWMVRALFVTGKKEEALELFQNLLTYSNHVMLFSEDLDFNTKEQLGNFPQAYSHLALINTALLFGEEIEFSRFIKP